MNDVEGLIASLCIRFEGPLADSGVWFQMRAARRLTATGVRRLLVLRVSPGDGFDDFEWALSERLWMSRTRAMMPLASVEDQVSAVLARYPSPPDAALFQDEYASRLREAYPTVAGCTLLRFPRTFAAAHNPEA